MFSFAFYFILNIIASFNKFFFLLGSGDGLVENHSFMVVMIGGMWGSRAVLGASLGLGGSLRIGICEGVWSPVDFDS